MISRSIRRLACVFPLCVVLLVPGTRALADDQTPSPAGARVYVITPADGDTVSSPVLIRFGLSGMGVAPAGVKFPNTGHHHLLVDAPLPPLDQPIPADKQHVHYGAGLTEAKLELAPGKHTLQLLLGDDKHVPHAPPVYSEPISIIVQ